MAEKQDAWVLRLKDEFNDSKKLSIIQATKMQSSLRT